MRERTIIGAYILSIATFVTIAVVGFVHFDRYGEQSERVAETHQVLTALEEALGQLRDLETGQRGYLIAGQKVFLEPYQQALTAVQREFGDVAELIYAASPSPEHARAQRERVRELQPVIEQKLEVTARSIRMFEDGQTEEARALVSSGVGKVLMDEIRRRVKEIADAERLALERRNRRAETTAWRTNLFLLFGNGLAFAFLTTGTLLIGRELNRRRRIEEKVGFEREQETLRDSARRAQRRLDAVVDEMPVGVVVTEGPNNDIVLANARMRQLYGAPLVAEQAGDERPTLQFLRADGAPYPLGRHPLARSFRDGEVMRGEEAQLRQADGRLRTVIVTAAPIRDADGRITSVIGIFHDGAEIERGEEERRRIENFRDLFVSALGHDLRNPLSVMTAGAASLSRRLKTAEDSKIVARMASSAERMARMIGQLLDLTQARLGGGLKVASQPSDLGEIAREVVDRLEVLHPACTIELVREGDLSGTWDPRRIQDVIENLITNALQHGARDRPVTVTARPAAQADRLVLEVHNWGNPVSEEMIPLMFDPFRRAQQRKRMKSVGLGLGLYLALQIVHAHGGTLDVESSADSGTLFRVVLPRFHD